MFVKFTPYQIQECLYDEERTQKFLGAINETVKKGDIVLDVGSGTGVLGMFAAKAGAKKVYCVEADDRFVPVIKQNIINNNLQDVMEVIHSDAAEVSFDFKFDVIIGELLDTGLFNEPQVQVMNIVNKFLKEGGKMLPQDCKSWVTPVSAQKELYGIDITYDARYEMLSGDDYLSDKILYDEVFFDKFVPVDLKSSVEFTANKDSFMNAVRIDSESKLSENFSAGESRFLFGPIIIFVKNPLNVYSGHRYKIDLEYKRGGDPLEALISVSELS